MSNDRTKEILAARATLRAAITKHCNAAIEDSWKGGGDPDDIPAIEAKLKSTHEGVTRAMDALETACRNAGLPNG